MQQHRSQSSCYIGPRTNTNTNQNLYRKTTEKVEVVRWSRNSPHFVTQRFTFALKRGRHWSLSCGRRIQCTVLPMLPYDPGTNSDLSLCKQFLLQPSWKLGHDANIVVFEDYCQGDLPDDRGSKHLRNNYQFLPDYNNAQHPSIQPSSHSPPKNLTL
jgi:hypothetical protein